MRSLILHPYDIGKSKKFSLTSPNATCSLLARRNNLTLKAADILRGRDAFVILEHAAQMLRIDIADRGTDVSKAYRRGKAASKVKLHSQEMMLAQVGSPLAIENAHRNLLDMEDNE